jgi:hypothetical protein
MALPLDGALYISNPRRTAASSRDALNGLGDLMAITISNPLLMNRMTARQARAHAKSMKRSKSGRFLPRRKAAKRRASKLTAAQRRRQGRKSQTASSRRSASRRRAKKMTSAQLEKLARRYGFVADVRRPKKRTISDAHKAYMQSQRKLHGKHRQTRKELGTIQGPLLASGDFDYSDEERAAMKKANLVRSYGSKAEMMAAGERPAYENRRRNPRRNRRNGRRNPTGFGLFDKIESFVAGVPVIGGLAPFVGPALVGATVGAVHYYAVKQVIGPAIQMLNPGFGFVKTVAEHGAYTIGGATVAGLLHIPMVADLLSRLGISGAFRTNLAVGAVMVGGAVDTLRYLKGDAATAYGDGMAYKVVPFGGLGYGTIEGGLSYGGLKYGTIEGGLDYSGVHVATRSNPIIMGRHNPIEGGLDYGNRVDIGGLGYGSPSLNGLLYAGEGM